MINLFNKEFLDSFKLVLAKDKGEKYSPIRDIAHENSVYIDGEGIRIRIFFNETFLVGPKETVFVIKDVDKPIGDTKQNPEFIIDNRECIDYLVIKWKKPELVSPDLKAKYNHKKRIENLLKDMLIDPVFELYKAKKGRNYYQNLIDAVDEYEA